MLLLVRKHGSMESMLKIRLVRMLGSILAVCIGLPGCVLSINPVITESNSTFDSRLLGQWELTSGSDRAVVSDGGDNTYVIEYTNLELAGRFEARLGVLEGRQVLDIWPTPSEEDQEQPQAGLQIAGHLLLAIEIDQEEISVTAFEPDSLLASIRSGDLKAPYRQNEGQLILTGSTEELRSALGPYLSASGAQSEPSVWHRAKNAQQRVEPVDVPCFEAAAWREADQLFHRDPRWLGGDVASSVDLGGGRLLWLFGDSWIDPSGSGLRQNGYMVSNSVAIQSGTDPSTAAIAFYWGSTADGRPTAMFPDRNGESLWFGNGVRVDDRLVLFFGRTIRNTGTGLGFEHVGWTAMMVENPDAQPSEWKVRSVETPPNSLGVLVGFAGVLQLGEHVYAFGSMNPVKSHPVFAARWPIEQVRRGNLLDPEWWAGERLGWVPNSSSSPRWPLFENGASELTIHFDEHSQRFLGVHTKGFGQAVVTMRASPTLTGPWSGPHTLYRPPEHHQPNVMIYAGKAHPQLRGADLVVTYATNTGKFSEHLTNPQSYYPHFVRLTRCDQR